MVEFFTPRALWYLIKFSIAFSFIAEIGISGLKNGKINAFRFHRSASTRHFDRPRSTESKGNRPATAAKASLLRKITDDRALGHVRLYLGIGATPKDILKRIRSGDETIVIVDTIRNLLRLQDEKDNSEVSRAILPYIAAAREKNKTLIMLHHNRKGGGEHGEAIAGAHAFFGVVDIALEIKRDGPDESNRRLLRGWASDRSSKVDL